MRVAGAVVGEFTGPGLVVLVGVTHTDTVLAAVGLANKIYDMRLFSREHATAVGVELSDDASRELSAADLKLPVLVISQFTLYAETKKGRRPTWDQAAPGPVAEPLVGAFVQALRDRGVEVATGQFGADMQVSLVNDGPVTITVEVDG
ncbi:D-aminoacyl-tRNA deacylase [Actinomycetes bacterium]|nr:D-aminoacyl-tRNA deacylase [Actinomycetes bacterium]